MTLYASQRRQVVKLDILWVSTDGSSICEDCKHRPTFWFCLIGNQTVPAAGCSEYEKRKEQ